MVSIMNSGLLQEKQVQEEIERHKWFESEKAGYDIGFEKAAQDWLDRYSQQWLKDHPNQTLKVSRNLKRNLKNRKA
jgi:hypothetical protein